MNMLGIITHKYLEADILICGINGSNFPYNDYLCISTNVNKFVHDFPYLPI